MTEPPEMLVRVRAQHWWIVATVAVLAVSLAARTVAAGVTRGVLIVDAVTLLAGAALIRVGVRRATGISQRARSWQSLLGIGFVLGAVRAGLWAAGVPVQWANATALALAVVAALTWAVRRRRAASASLQRGNTIVV